MNGMTDGEQFQCLNTIAYLEDLFTVAEKEQFSRAEVLVILNHVKTDPEIFDPEVVIAHQIACEIACEELDEQERQHPAL